MLEDVIDDDLLGLIGVHSSERVHVDDRIFKTDQRNSQSSFQSLKRTRINGNLSDRAQQQTSILHLYCTKHGQR